MVYEEINDSFRRLVRIMERLQEPGGCPWDLEQTHESLKQYLLEEAYETLEAIDRQDYVHLREELGDILLQVVFHSVLARRFNRFTIDEVIEGAAEKMVRRHPHVFGDVQAETSGDVLRNWEKLKAEERRLKSEAEKQEKSDEPRPLLASIPTHLPALLKAQRMQEKAARVGFEFPTAADAVAKLQEELRELSVEVGKVNTEGMETEFGDVVFALVNLARILDINAEEATRQTCEKFRDRFSRIEAAAREKGSTLDQLSKEEMAEYWADAKRPE